jgi:N,N'-diacetyllegionaminate synthase
MDLEIIAEVANSHQGQFNLAKKIVKTFFKEGATSIKFQIYFAEDFLTSDHERFNHFKKQSFSENQWLNLIKITKKVGFKNVYADILGLKAFKVAKKLNLDGYKIHSTDLSNDLLLEKIAKEEKKIFLSVGGAKITEIYHALSYFENKKNKPILMHGFQSYPTRIEDTNLDNIKKLKNYFGNKCQYGFQDHISGNSKYNLYISLVSLGYGINYLEKHITLSRGAKGIDYYSSLEPNEFKKFCNIIQKSMNSKTIQKSGFSIAEDLYRKKTKKFWILKKKLKKNSIIKLNDLDFKRINNLTMEPLFLKEILGKRINQNLDKNTIISNNYFNHKIYALIVARYNSKRLPGKAMLKISGRPLLEHLFFRIKESKLIDKIIFCTTNQKSDDILVKLAKKNKILFFRGEEKNVLGRMLKSTKKEMPDVIIRITGDDILVDPNYMDEAINYHLSNNLDYTDHKKLPSGIETEIFNRKILNFININSEDNTGTEYLTYYIKNNEEYFRTGSADVKDKHKKNIRLTIDNLKDYKFVKPFIEKMNKDRKLFTYNVDDIINFYKYKNNNQIFRKKNTKINTRLKKFSYKKL